MNVDDALWIALDERRRQDPHVARQDNEVDGVRLEQLDLTALDARAVVAIDRHVMERDAMKACEFSRLRVIADDDGDGPMQLAVLMAVQQVRKAVELVRDEDG